MAGVNTMPGLAREWGESLDTLRAIVRRDAKLRTLGSKIGATRVFTDAEAKQIRAVMESRKKPEAAA